MGEDEACSQGEKKIVVYNSTWKSFFGGGSK